MTTFRCAKCGHSANSSNTFKSATGGHKCPKCGRAVTSVQRTQSSSSTYDLSSTQYDDNDGAFGALRGLAEIACDVAFTRLYDD